MIHKKRKHWGQKYMPRVTIDFGKDSGVVKPMYAVNNGPLPVSVRGTFDNGAVQGIRNSLCP